jgi:glycosyltransferase involved in cell wall biosynthesis
MLLCSDLRRYPLDTYASMSSLSTISDRSTGIFCGISSETIAHHPVYVAQLALAHWNAYLTHGDDEHKTAFISLANWLLNHASLFANNTGGWPIPYILPGHSKSLEILSSLAQGQGISVLIRAYQLTGKDDFLRVAGCVVRTFELDILDGGVHTPVGKNGVFFEEAAVYPATHVLSSHILALFGLYDYVAITGDHRIETLIKRSITTLHTGIKEFDTGYWTYHNLLHKHLSTQFHHSLHIVLLNALVEYSGSEYFATLACRWQGYQNRTSSRLRYLAISSFMDYCGNQVKSLLRPSVSKDPYISDHHVRVCVPVEAFPALGGVASVLAEVADVMKKQWQITYLTTNKRPTTEKLEIIEYGRISLTSTWQFPNVWLYCLAGGSKLFRLLRRPGFDLILPQDGIASSAFAALVGKLMGTRTICMDHGHMTCLVNASFRNESTQSIVTYPWYKRSLSHLRLACYWPSLYLLARVATLCADHFLVVGDEVEQVYREQLGVHPWRITRYVYNVDIDRFTPPDSANKIQMRFEQGLPENGIVITLINRLALEKGLSFALEGIALALSKLAPDVRKRVRVLIAGDGPLRSQVEADILRYNLEGVCILWGEANASEVVKLLAISDIFLYSGTRGTNYSMAVLEAMAAGCAVVASTSPQSNAKLLKDGRGIAIAPGDAQAIGTALVRLCNDLELCQHMGQLARAYVATYHSAEMLRRTLMRVSFFVPQLDILNVKE